MWYSELGLANQILRAFYDRTLSSSVVDPEWINPYPDPDPTFQVVPDPNSNTL